MAGQLKILIVGGGGREHALAWKAAHSPQVARVYVEELGDSILNSVCLPPCVRVVFRILCQQIDTLSPEFAQSSRRHAGRYTAGHPQAGGHYNRSVFESITAKPRNRGAWPECLLLSSVHPPIVCNCDR